MSEDPVTNNQLIPTAPTHALCVETATMLPVTAQGTDLSSVLYKVHSPYVPEAWRLALNCTGLTQSFLNLVHDLTYGSPIGNPPPLGYTFIPPNLKSADLNPVYMESIIQEELLAR